ncbi:major facilitator superfamily domain-containing protein [Mycena epipterygia]|nr:major facilitator superfamily domain-containing protein [Mycena epipterygia]
MATESEPHESQPLLHDQTTHATVTPLPKAQLAALFIAKLSDPISESQIFPYINELLIVLHVTDDPSKIGFYSGLDSTSSIAQVMTIFHWAKLSDVVGRRPVILAGALGLAVVSLLLGFCHTFLQILAVRAITGLLMGNAAVYHIVLAEITDSTNQAGPYPIYGGISPLGSTIGPFIGGLFSNLATKYPECFRYRLLESYPYLMPGFICASLAMLGFILTYFFLEETLPSKRENVPNDDAVIVASNSSSISIRELLVIPNIRTLAFSSFALSFLSTAYAVVFVLFCYTPIERGGLAFSVAEIGYALALASIILAMFQLLLMPTLLRTFDIAKMYIFCMGVWPITFILLPFLNLIARMELDAETSRSKFNYKGLLWIGIIVVQICWRFACLAYPNNMILVRSNCPTPSALGAANGLNQLVMTLSRCISPIFIRLAALMNSILRLTVAGVSAVFALSVDNNLLGGHLWVVVMTLISAFGFYISRTVENPERHK